MHCEFTKLGDAQVVICRGRRPKKRCAVAGCGRPASKQCDFPLAGEMEGKTCDRYLCDVHGIKQGAQVIEGRSDSLDYCPAHDRVARERAAMDRNESW